jgi:S1-C subfamily serine protease
MKVTDLRPGGPAEEGGLKEGDLITSVGGQKPKDRNDFLTKVWSRKPGQALALKIRRGEAEKDLEVRLGRHPDD